MKKIKLNTAKLQLKKEKISNLTNEELDQVKGGATGFSPCAPPPTTTATIGGTQSALNGTCPQGPVEVPGNSVIGGCLTVTTPTGNSGTIGYPSV